MSNERRIPLGAIALGTLLLAFLAGPASGQGVVPQDWCGCEGVPNLGDLRTSDPATWPVVDGQLSERVGNSLRLPLPEDGVLVFSSLVVDGFDDGSDGFLSFVRNAANTPVTLLSVGDIEVQSGQFVTLNGATGGAAQPGLGGRGSPGGPGGFRGGNGIDRNRFPAAVTESGAGPGGGSAAASGAAGGHATYVASFLPLVGGSGGAGSSTSRTDSQGGGGGGGGGALLAVSNGTVRVDGTIRARGGPGGSDNFIAGAGGTGSGGTIRILATAVTGSGKIDVSGGFGSNPGRIRVEALSNDLVATAYVPVTRVQTRGAPGPLRNPLAPSVSITAVGGEVVVQPTLGWRGPEDGFGPHVDVLVPSAGPVDVGVRTSGVPSGTSVNLTVKPRPGFSTGQSVSLDSCDAAGVCDAVATFDLTEGDYTIEARATFAP